MVSVWYTLLFVIDIKGSLRIECSKVFAWSTVLGMTMVRERLDFG